MSPWVDLEMTGESVSTKASVDPILTRDLLLHMARLYLGETSPRNVLASPIHADLRGLPPLLILVGEAEILLDDAIRLAARAAAQGVKVRLDAWPNMIHIWQHFACFLAEGRQAIADAGRFIEDLFIIKK